MAEGLFPARGMRNPYREELWCKARSLYFERGMTLQAICHALRINRNTCYGRAWREKWEYYRNKGEAPEWFFTPKKEVRLLRMAGHETNAWQRRKKLDKRRLEVINEAAERIMTREEKAKEQLDRIVDRTPALLKAMDDAVESLSGYETEDGPPSPEIIMAVKDLVSTHAKLCGTLQKLEQTPHPKTGGIPVEGGWIGILGAVRLRDEGKVLQSQVATRVEELKEDAVDVPTLTQGFPPPVPFHTPQSPMPEPVPFSQ